MKPFQIKQLELKFKIYVDSTGTLYNKNSRNEETGWAPIPQKWIENAKRFKQRTVCGYCGADVDGLNKQARTVGLCNDCFVYFK